MISDNWFITPNLPFSSKCDHSRHLLSMPIIFFPLIGIVPVERENSNDYPSKVSAGDGFAKPWDALNIQLILLARGKPVILWTAGWKTHGGLI